MADRPLVPIIPSLLVGEFVVNVALLSAEDNVPMPATENMVEPKSLLVPNDNFPVTSAENGEDAPDKLARAGAGEGANALSTSFTRSENTPTVVAEDMSVNNPSV